MVLEIRQQTGERHGAVTRVAKELGIGVESLRQWVNQAEVDSGRRPGTSSADAQRIAELERENRELCRANDPNRIWIYDAIHFGRARRVVFAIVDMVSRKWIDTLVSVEETATQVQVLFEHAVEAEGLLDLLTDERLDLAVDDPARPILLAVSDNGPPMAAADTKAFLVLMAIAQHRGRPHTPTDQAWIESFFGPIKADWPHLEDITDPGVLGAELDRVRAESRYAGDPPLCRVGLGPWVRYRLGQLVLALSPVAGLDVIERDHWPPRIGHEFPGVVGDAPGQPAPCIPGLASPKLRSRATSTSPCGTTLQMFTAGAPAGATTLCPLLATFVVAPDDTPEHSSPT
jgi:transposase InsO family protein